LLVSPGGWRTSELYYLRWQAFWLLPLTPVHDSVTTLQSSSESQRARHTSASLPLDTVSQRPPSTHSLRPVRRQPLRVKVPRTLVEPLESLTVRSFLERCHHYRDLAIVYLMLLCGLRLAEVLALRLSDISFAEARLRVWGKGSKERALPLPPLLLQLLQDYVQLERPDGTRSERLFLLLKGRARGKAMTPAGLRSLFRYRRQEEGLAKANAHRFRHTFGADMARAGVRLPVLQRMMGHAHAETTVQYINLAVTDVVAEYQRASARIHARYAARSSSGARGP
jgi:integrase/recombinase XerD